MLTKKMKSKGIWFELEFEFDIVFHLNAVELSFLPFVS